MLKEIENQPSESQNPSTGEDAMALILQQAGKSSDEVAALSTLDDADQTAENQFSGEALPSPHYLGLEKLTSLKRVLLLLRKRSRK